MNIHLGANPSVRFSYQSGPYSLASGQTGAGQAQPTTPPAAGPGTPAPQTPGTNPGGFLDTVTRGLVTLTYEGGAVLQNDPALAVREFATRVHELSSRGYGSADLTAWSPFIGAGARTLILGANAMRVKKTFETEGSSLLEKSLDVARVATDLAGVTGAILRVAMPSQARLGTMLMGIAQSADLVSHGARFGMHSAPRVKNWLKNHEEKQAREREREKKARQAGEA